MANHNAVLIEMFDPSGAVARMPRIEPIVDVAETERGGAFILQGCSAQGRAYLATLCVMFGIEFSDIIVLSETQALMHCELMVGSDLVFKLI